MPKAGALERAIIQHNGMGNLPSLDFTFIAHRADDGMILGDLWIVEEVNIRAWGRANIHDILEEQKLFPTERTLGHPQPGIPGKQFHDANHRPDAQADRTK